MGNQLVGIAPSQIYPVEHYLTEHPELQFDISLGSTRFFKVARAKSQEGLIVAKVFAIHDPTLPLSTYKDKLEDIRIKLASAVNCLPFQRAVLTEKAGVIMREYVKYSLYDRISTRPFLSLIEKKWIAFQLLYALHQCHKVGVCHGDIKLENIMITSWNWVLLTDFASFKPTYLPEDNPADFSYFFDTSRRRTCYIAPERFIKTLNSEISSQLLLPEEDLKKGDLTPAMDIFSAGCALTELFNEGHPPFDFSQLLSYRNGEYSAWKHLEKIEDSGIRELLRSMMEKDASLRLSAEVYLDQQRGKVFPEYFYSFLQSYMLIFSAVPIISLDEKVSRLKKDIKNIVKILKPDPESQQSEKRDSCAEGKKESEDAEKEDVEGISGGRENKDSENCLPSENALMANSESDSSEGLVIVASLVTSCVRGVHHCNSKLSVLEVLLELSAHTSSETVLDRILPYIFHLLHDPFPRVRVMAIHTLTKCLSLVKLVPCSDANIFPEYVLPNLAMVIHDEAVMVRAAYAENIAQLAITALRFLEQSQLSVSESGNPLGGGHRGSDTYSNRASNAGVCTSGYDSELQTLHQMIQDTVATLLTDPENVVKRTLVENGITQLCVFFGKQKANDVLLSHMITFLNDKEDRHLRGSFFDCIVGVAAYVGCHSSPILCPLLQQGLTDLEEFVVTKAINAMTALAELSLLQKPALYELLKETTCFLVHPNLWIRHAIVGFISAIARTLNLVDVQCKVMAVIQPYLKHPVIQIDKEVLLLNALKPPVPRVVYDSVVRCPDIGPLLQALADRHTARCTMTYLPPIPMGNNSDPSTHTSLRNLFRRLSSEGMTEEVESQLIAMGEHLKKINRHHKASTGSGGAAKDLDPSRNQNYANGKIELANLKQPIQSHVITLVNVESKGDATALIQNRKNRSKKGSGYDGHTVTMNEEWRHMFGTAEPESTGKHNESGSVSPVRTSAPSASQTSTVEATDQSGSQDAPPSTAPPLVPPPTAGEPNTTNPLAPPAASVAPASTTITSSTSSCSSSPNRGSEVDHSLQEHSYIQYRCAPCRLELRELLRRKQDQQAVAVSGRDWAEQSMWEPQRTPPPGWRLRGNLVAHLHEHRGAVNRLVAVPETPLFASCSSDGCIRIWDCGKMEGRNIANRSRQVYNRQGGPLVGLTTCENHQSLASASHSGGIFVLRIEANSNKMAVLQSRQLDLQEEGCAVDISHFESGSQSVVVYATLYGSIVGWDLRCPGNAWKLENDLRLGVITSLCVDSRQSWLTVGTSSGYHVCWDLRFQLPISTIVHPSRARVRRLVRHPLEQSWVISAVQGHNEISLWDLETQSRRAVLWASPSPPLSQTQMSPHSVCTMAVGLVDRAPFLLAGGTDMRLRHWDLESPSSSCIAIPAASDPPHMASSVSYESRLIDGTNVVVEVAQSSRQYSSHHHQPGPPSSVLGSGPLRSSSSLSMGSVGNPGLGSSGGQGISSGQDCPRPGPEQPPAGHHDWISDVALCQATQCFLLTGSRDGVIKVWK
ncbi:phosphoinositide 3-kinase regulatory subunit 4 [Hetaerina americana]|uniref:phosphoinositide 3-kinase regulatory subunit 4 n=1 Tax=Hetaerina americana TaxID=62018 RepID=UPI003A7F454D